MYNVHDWKIQAEQDVQNKEKSYLAKIESGLNIMEKAIPANNAFMATNIVKLPKVFYNLRINPVDFNNQGLAHNKLDICLRYVKVYNKLFRAPEKYLTWFKTSFAHELSETYSYALQHLSRVAFYGLDAENSSIVVKYIESADEKKLETILDCLRFIVLFDRRIVSLEKNKEFFSKFSGHIQTKVDQMKSARLKSKFNVLEKCFTTDQFTEKLTFVKELRAGQRQSMNLIERRESKYEEVKVRKGVEKILAALISTAEEFKKIKDKLSLEEIKKFSQKEFFSFSDFNLLIVLIKSSLKSNDRESAFKVLEILGDIMETIDYCKMNYPKIPKDSKKRFEAMSVWGEFSMRSDNLFGYATWCSANILKKLDFNKLRLKNKNEEKVLYNLLTNLLFFQTNTTRSYAATAMDGFLTFINNNKSLEAVFPEIFNYLKTKEFEIKLAQNITILGHYLRSEEFINKKDPKIKKVLIKKYNRLKDEFQLVISRYGINGDKALDFWLPEKDPDQLPEKFYIENLRQIHILENKLPGSVKFLHEQFNIIHFFRYPVEILIEQCRQFENANNPYILILNPNVDWNGAFNKDSLLWKRLFKSLKKHKYLLRIVEAGNKFEIIRELTRLKKKYGQSGGAFIGGHGTIRSIQFGPDEDQEDTSHSIYIKDLVKANFRNAARNFFHDDATIVLNSCSTGKAEGIAQKFSKTGLRVIGPKLPTSMESIEVIFDQQSDNVKFKIKYHTTEKRGPLEKGYFEGREIEV